MVHVWVLGQRFWYLWYFQGQIQLLGSSSPKRGSCCLPRHRFRDCGGHCISDMLRVLDQACTYGLFSFVCMWSGRSVYSQTAFNWASPQVDLPVLGWLLIVTPLFPC